MNNKILKFGYPQEKSANADTRVNGTRNARERGNARKTPLKLKARLKARSKVLRFPRHVAFEQNIMKLTSSSATTDQFFW